MHGFIRYFILFALLTTLSACSPSISVSPDTQAALDAYNQMIDLLKDCSSSPETCDKEKIWDNMDSTTKNQFVHAYASLKRIDTIITTYFDPIEHKEMRSRTGSDIFETDAFKAVESENFDSNEAEANKKGFTLFAYIFHPEALSLDKKNHKTKDVAAQIESGLKPIKVAIAEDKKNCIEFHTNQDGQSFEMIRESDGVWRMAGFSNAVSAALAPIFSNEANMRDYASLYLQEELQRRTRVRDYFLLQDALRKQQVGSQLN